MRLNFRENFDRNRNKKISKERNELKMKLCLEFLRGIAYYMALQYFNLFTYIFLIIYIMYFLKQLFF